MNCLEKQQSLVSFHTVAFAHHKCSKSRRVEKLINNIQ